MVLLLVVGLLLGEQVASPAATTECQTVLDTWCRMYSKCIAEIAADH